MRVEIIANQSVQEDILEAIQKEQPGVCYTKIPSVHGIGSSDPRLGDSIWPEENFLLIIYCEERQAERIAGAVAGVKSRFEGEGIKVFAIRQTEELL
jgi:hypothetical protein